MNYFNLIKDAWKDFDNNRKIKNITDISIKVSINHVYRIILKDESIAKKLIQDSIDLYLPNINKIVISSNIKENVLS